jgi:hypothetical protein
MLESDEVMDAHETLLHQQRAEALATMQAGGDDDQAGAGNESGEVAKHMTYSLGHAYRRLTLILTIITS